VDLPEICSEHGLRLYPKLLGAPRSVTTMHSTALLIYAPKIPTPLCCSSFCGAAFRRGHMHPGFAVNKVAFIALELLPAASRPVLKFPPNPFAERFKRIASQRTSLDDGLSTEIARKSAEIDCLTNLQMLRMDSRKDTRVC
jgi:hypothetical protein